jgi:hypothetical protein
MRFQVSIAGVMTIVAVVALNAAIARALFAYDEETLIGIALPSLALQWAVFSLVRRRLSNRAFWISFAAFGSMAMASFVLGRVLPNELIAVAYPGQPSQLVNVSRVSAFWLGYGSYAGHLLEPWLGSFQFVADPKGFAAVVIRALVWSVPQLLVALVGGLCALVIGPARFGILGQSPREATA